MSRNNIMFLSLAFLAFFCFQTQAFYPFKAYSSKINAHATSSGIIDIKKDEYGTFYVEADLVDTQTGIPDPRPANMMISLSNTDSMLAIDCLSFTFYDCAQYHCNKYSGETTVDFPSFTATVEAAGGYIYLDSSHWALIDSYWYLAQSCQSKDLSSRIGLNRYGVLGLGTRDPSNFKSSKMFSVSIASDFSKGTLSFKNDAQSSQPLYTLSTNSAWKLSFEKGSIELPDYAIAYDNGNLVFDINSDAIGLPYDIYTLFIKYFTMTPGVRCDSESKYRPTCYFTGQIGDLPNVTISCDNGKLNIPSKIYATLLKDDGDGGESSFSLNFKGTDPSFSDKSFVTTTFKNSFILDANFMSYYYTVFDFTTGNNIISIYPSRNNADPGDNNTPWIVVGCIGVIVLAGLGYYVFVKKKKSSNNIPLMQQDSGAAESNQTGVLTSVSYYPGYTVRSSE